MYRERERDTCVYIYMHIYVYIHICGGAKSPVADKSRQWLTRSAAWQGRSDGRPPPDGIRRSDIMRHQTT